MLVLRSTLFNIVFYAVLAALAVAGLPSLLFGYRGVMGVARLWGRTSVRLLWLICGTRVEVRGRHLVPDGACIVAAKHQSMLEIFALLGAFPGFTFVLKRELAFIPVFGWYIAASGQIAIDRARGRAALSQLIEQARGVLARGRPILIFPEGTRRPPGAEARYKFGVAFLYAETGARCVPVALNSGLFWSRRSFVRRPGTVVIEILPPIEPGLGRAEFAALLQERIEEASRRLLKEALDRDPSLARALVPARS